MSEVSKAYAKADMDDKTLIIMNRSLEHPFHIVTVVTFLC